MKEINISASHMSHVGDCIDEEGVKTPFTHKIIFPRNKSYSARVYQEGDFIYLMFESGNLWRCTREKMKEHSDYFKSSWSISFRKKRVS